MDSLMTSIDTIKEKITDAEYKELCDKMMELNNQRKSDTKYYRVWYVSTNIYVVRDDHDDDQATTNFYPKFENKIIKLCPKTVEDKRRLINERGGCVMDHKILGVERQSPLPVITNCGVYYLQSTDNRDYAVVRIDDLE
jgi:hypothetical protein